MVENPVDGIGGPMDGLLRAGVDRTVIGFTLAAVIIGGNECDGGNDGGGESNDGGGR